MMIETSGLFFSVFLAIRLNHYAAHMGFVGPTSHTVDVTDMRITFFVRVIIDRSETARERHVTKP
jgi:hypothetical protein